MDETGWGRGVTPICLSPPDVTDETNSMESDNMKNMNEKLREVILTENQKD